MLKYVKYKRMWNKEVRKLSELKFWKQKQYGRTTNLSNNFEFIIFLFCTYLFLLTAYIIHSSHVRVRSIILYVMYTDTFKSERDY